MNTMPACLAELLTRSEIVTAPDQVWQSIRLVPLVTTKVYDDLYLAKSAAPEGRVRAAVDKHKVYSAYVPHGLVLRASTVASRTQLGPPEQRWEATSWEQKYRLVHKGKQALHFLPQHLAISSFLAQYFEAPPIYWKDFYNRRSLKEGVGLRTANSLPGTYFDGLETALRHFEIYPRQVGMLLFMNDQLVNAVIYPHPRDYRALHALLLHDYYGQELWWSTLHHPQMSPLLPDDLVQGATLGDLKAHLHQHLQHITDFHGYMTRSLFREPVRWNKGMTYKDYRLHTFLGPMTYGQTGFAGEVIFSQERVAYLHAFWLSPQQVKEAWYCQHLEAHNWNPEATARALNMDFYTFVRKLADTHLRHMIQGPWIERAYKAHLTSIKRP